MTNITNIESEIISLNKKKIKINNYLTNGELKWFYRIKGAKIVLEICKSNDPLAQNKLK